MTQRELADRLSLKEQQIQRYETQNYSGASFARTYDKPGTFDYVCAVHPYMTGKVVVGAQ